MTKQRRPMTVRRKGIELMELVHQCGLSLKNYDAAKEQALNEAFYTLTESGMISEGVDGDEALKIWKIVEAITQHIGMPEELIL